MEITTELELLKSNQSETQVNSRSLDAQPHGDALPAQRELGDPDFGVLVSFLAPRFITWCKLNKKKKKMTFWEEGGSWFCSSSSWNNTSFSLVPIPSDPRGTAVG